MEGGRGLGHLRYHCGVPDEQLRRASYLECAAHDFDSLAGCVDLLAHLTELGLHGNGVEDLSALNEMPPGALPLLETLDFRGCKNLRRLEAWVGCLPNLKMLNLF